MRLLAFAASSSRNSINRRLIGYATGLITDELGPAADLGVDVEILDLRDYEMPIYSIDREHEGGIPQQAKDFFERIGAADGLLLSLAEHNGLFTVAYKNVFDWASRIDMCVYQNTPTAMLAASPGRGGGTNVLRVATASAPFFGAEVTGQLSVPSFNHTCDPETGAITDPELDAELRTVLSGLLDAMVAAGSIEGDAGAADDLDGEG
ncbi:MAG: NAD(P)H-dependent oxidoreductase [Actinomycetota bacterium]